LQRPATLAASCGGPWKPKAFWKWPKMRETYPNQAERRENAV
jgi:hypothetical protein